MRSLNRVCYTRDADLQKVLNMATDLVWEDDTEYYRVLTHTHTHTQSSVDALPQEADTPTSFEITCEGKTGLIRFTVQEEFPGLEELLHQFDLFQKDPDRNEAPYILLKHENPGVEYPPLYRPSRDPYLYPLVS